jgi:hypothetical protein
MKKTLLPLTTALLAGGILNSNASVLVLETGKSLSLSPSSSGTITFSAGNDAGDITADFLGWTLGIQLLPSGTTTGSLTLGSLTQPVSNPMPDGSAGSITITQPSTFTLANSASINNSTTYSQIAIEFVDPLLGTVLSNTSYNLGTLSINSSANASGTWNLYAVQQAGGFHQSYWTDGSLTDNDFGNLPRGAGNSSILIGTVSITGVPEPTQTWVMGGCLAVGFILRRQGRVSAFWR